MFMVYKSGMNFYLLDLKNFNLFVFKRHRDVIEFDRTNKDVILLEDTDGRVSKIMPHLFTDEEVQVGDTTAAFWAFSPDKADWCTACCRGHLRCSWHGL